MSEKRAGFESAESNTTIPLTQENLLLLQVSMSSPPSKKVKMGKAKTTAQRRQTMGDNKMLIDDYNVMDKANEFKALAREIVDAERLSGMSQGQEQAFLKKRQEYELRTESTFIMAMWHLLVSQERNIKKPSPNDDEIDKEDLLLRSWEIDGLDFNWNQPIDASCLPKMDTAGNEELEALLKLDGPVEKPEPDLIYAVNLSVFTESEQIIVKLLEGTLPQVSAHIYFPFISIQFKAHNGKMQDAINQACRDGTVMVFYMRKLKGIAGILDEKHRNDYGSFAFSLAMTPLTAILHVHWADSVDGIGAHYHMHTLGQYGLNVEGGPAKLKHDLGNILDWGVKDRKHYIAGLLPLVKKYLDENPKVEGSSKASEGTKVSEDE